MVRCPLLQFLVSVPQLVTDTGLQAIAPGQTAPNHQCAQTDTIMSFLPSSYPASLALIKRQRSLKSTLSQSEEQQDCGEVYQGKETYSEL